MEDWPLATRFEQVTISHGSVDQHFRGQRSTLVRMSDRPHKRARPSQPASYQDAIPIGDEFGMVYTQEHRNTYQPQPMERSAQLATDSWATITFWTPPDDPTFALDPDCEWYDIALDTHILEDVGVQANPKKKKPRSMVSVSILLGIPVNSLSYLHDRSARMSPG